MNGMIEPDKIIWIVHDTSRVAVTEFDGKDTFVCEHGFASTEQKGETAWPTCRTRAHIALVAARLRCQERRPRLVREPEAAPRAAAGAAAPAVALSDPAVKTQRFTASAVSAGFELKHSFDEAGACRWTILINFSNNRKYGGTTRRPVRIMMQSYLLVVSASVSTASAVLPSSTYSNFTLQPSVSNLALSASTPARTFAAVLPIH